MKTKLAAALIVLAALAPGATIWLAPLASADSNEQGYLNQLAAIGIQNTNGDQGSLNAGYAMCAMLRKGAAESAVIDYVDRMSHLNAYDAGYNVDAAEIWLCPDVLDGYNSGWAA